MQKRADLAATVIASFAAPLMDMSGQNGAVLAVMGEPASGKTYAMEVGCAVWGHPVKTRESENSTDKSVENRLGSTQNLPAFWDEVTSEEVKTKAFKLTNITTAGATGGRATQSARQRLTHNFGMMGIAYSKYLAANHVAIQAQMTKNADWLSTKLQGSKEDRMWLAVCTAMLTGAEVANMLPRPVGFDIPALVDFLCETWEANRYQRENANVNPASKDYGEDYLTQFLKDRTTQTMWTQGYGKANAGKPGNVEFYLLQGNVALHHGVQVRCDKADNTLRFSKKNFEEWCERDPGRVPATIVVSLQKTYKMTTDRCVLAAGTPFKTGRESLYVIDATSYPELRAFVQRTDDVDNQALGVSSATVEEKQAPEPVEHINTGLTADLVKKLATDVDLAKKVRAS